MYKKIAWCVLGFPLGGCLCLGPISRQALNASSVWGIVAERDLAECVPASVRSKSSFQHSIS